MDEDSRNQPIRLGRGEFDSAGGLKAQYAGRRLFIAAVANTTPDVLASLKREVLPVYQATPRLPALAFLSLDATADWRATPRVRDHPMFQQLFSWADRWNLRDDWCIEVALDALRDWSEGNPEREWTRVRGAWVKLVQPTAYSVTFDAWDTDATLSSNYERAMLERAKIAIRQHIESVKESVLRQGGQPVVVKRTIEHFDWLVRYQCLGERYGTIAADVSVETTSVESAVKDTAALIALTLRPTKRGRPRKIPVSE